VTPPITCLFVDIGGVLLSNGWDRPARRRAAVEFGLDWDEMDERHRQAFGTYEEGKSTLDEYLDRVIFHRARGFTPARFSDFMFAQSTAYPEMIALITRLKARYGLKLGVVSNEGRELNAFRIQKFKLSPLLDFFVSSCYVGMRKPDTDMLRLALDLAQTPVEEIVYLENTAMFVTVAEGQGIRSILHTDCESTRAALSGFGLPDETRAPGQAMGPGLFT
jgi:putative hydrolase of the HAD superfamily